jgi:hypothetical protein
LHTQSFSSVSLSLDKELEKKFNFPGSSWLLS